MAEQRGVVHPGQGRAPWWALVLTFVAGLALLVAAAALCSLTAASWARLAGLDPDNLELGAVVILGVDPLLALLVGIGVWAAKGRWTKRAQRGRRMRVLAVAVLMVLVLGNALNAYAVFFGGL